MARVEIKQPDILFKSNIDLTLDEFIQKMESETFFTATTPSNISRIERDVQYYNDYSGFDIKVGVSDRDDIYFYNIPTTEEIRSMKISKIKRKTYICKHERNF